MKQGLYKKTYQQLCMTEEQKNNVWQRIQAERTRTQNTVRFKAAFPARAAVCAGVFLVSGMTVLAAGEFSVMDRLAEAMGFFTENAQEPTEEQKNIFAQYGIALGNEISMTHGTLKLDAALYDGAYLFIPFRYAFHEDTAGFAELKEGTDIRNTSLWNAGKVAGYHEDLVYMDNERLSYRIQQDTKAVTGFLMKFQHEIVEDGVLSGSILLWTNKDSAFAKGDVIEVVRHVQESAPNEQNEEQIKILTSFTLENPVEQSALALDSSTRSALGELGLEIEYMTISPLSLQYTGSGTHRDITHTYMEVVLKDNSVAGDMGAGYETAYSAAEQEITAFRAHQFFTAPVLPEEIAGVRVWNDSAAEVWIDVK
ncbi:MAG: hypothetical protein HFH79_16950 [Lachnospiraceae bacterium]|nr:hypothetical protein [Lachnospiraceae bacterium]